MPEIEGFLLAAGLGSRMGPLSVVLPKPAWTLQGRPLLQWGAESMRRAGIERLGCNAHLHPEKLRAAAGGLEVFEEPQLQGSAGGLRAALSRVSGPLVVWNADAIAEVPWAALRAGFQNAQAELDWLLVPHPGGPWTQVWLGADNRVLPKGEPGRGPFHFTGASLWSRSALALIPEGPSNVSALLPRLFHRGVVVEPFPWREVGTPDALIAAAADLAPEHEGRLPGCYLHPTSKPLGRLKRCVLGPGAHPPEAVEDEGAFWFEESGRQVRLGLP